MHHFDLRHRVALATSGIGMSIARGLRACGAVVGIAGRSVQKSNQGIKSSVLGLGAVVLASGCAPTPESVQPAYVSEVPYQSWTCEQLAEESLRLQQALATASVAQSSARTNDTVGIILIGLPVGSMSGQSIAPQIALYKGQLESVHRASIRNSCPAPATTSRK